MKPILNWLEHFEESINKLLKKLIVYLAKLFSPVFSFVQYCKKKISSFINKKNEALQNNLDQLSGIMGPRAFSFYHHKFSLWMLKLKQSITQALLADDDHSSFHKIKQKLISIIKIIAAQFSIGRVAILGILLLIMGINGLYLLQKSEQLKLIVQEDELAKIPSEELRKLPGYYNQMAKSSLLKEVIIPALLPEEVGPYEVRTKDLRIDCYIVFKSRTAKKIFDAHTLLFIDELHLRMRPVVPTFPLNSEGQAYLVQWLKEVIESVLLEHSEIKNAVEQIYIVEKLAQ